MSLFVEKTIRIALGFGTSQPFVKAMCFQEFAVHRSIDLPHLWVITLIPLGTVWPMDWCSFETERQAQNAAIEMARLRNDWPVITKESFTLELRDQLMKIAANHGAIKDGPTNIAAVPGTDRFGKPVKRFNGYVAEA